ncbi:hypothetical protein DOY81_013440 [Sarcophaga bullata]|nr:hypothetical protein DOY81_013440 [Sarcophaga bullata]
MTVLHLDASPLYQPQQTVLRSVPTEFRHGQTKRLVMSRELVKNSSTTPSAHIALSRNSPVIPGSPPNPSIPAFEPDRKRAPNRAAVRAKTFKMKQSNEQQARCTGTSSQASDEV